MRIMVTGGAGFIGNHLVRRLLMESNNKVLNVDKLTYAGSLEALTPITNHRNYQFSQTDICDTEKLSSLLQTFKPEVVFHLAAESHVDRSIDSPTHFIQSNIVGTFSLLEAIRIYWKQVRPQNFRLISISTDEVYGDLELNDSPFDENNRIKPSSPYSASKAAADHLVDAWHRTYQIPTITTHCSNNYGPWQYPEKLIPLMIRSALEHKRLPVYGDGLQRRDWLHVDDHVSALMMLINKGRLGEHYNIGGDYECSNIDLVKQLCRLLIEQDRSEGKQTFDYCSLISMVNDRPGHDRRYAINSDKIQKEIGWCPNITFEQGLKATVAWYYARYV